MREPLVVSQSDFNGRAGLAQLLRAVGGEALVLNGVTFADVEIKLDRVLRDDRRQERLRASAATRHIVAG